MYTGQALCGCFALPVTGIPANGLCHGCRTPVLPLRPPRAGPGGDRRGAAARKSAAGQGLCRGAGIFPPRFLQIPAGRREFAGRRPNPCFSLNLTDIHLRQPIREPPPSNRAPLLQMLHVRIYHLKIIVRKLLVEELLYNIVRR